MALGTRPSRLIDRVVLPDAVGIYQRQIDPIVNTKKNHAHREAAKLIRKIKKPMARLGREDDFPPYLESVRKTHKPKRNLMAVLKEIQPLQS